MNTRAISRYEPKIWKRHDTEADRNDEERRRNRNEQVDGRGDRADVGAGVESVGDDQRRERRVEHPAGVVLAAAPRQGRGR